METTQILIPGSDAYILAGEYSDFTASLYFFASICAEKPRRAKSDYLNAFKGVKRSYESLLAVRKIAAWATYPVDRFLEDVSKEFHGKRIDDVDLVGLHNLVEDFLAYEVLSPYTRSLRHAYLLCAVSSHARDFYSDELFDVISSPLENNEYDAAVLAAFKYLDSILQRLAGVDSYQFYGEDLINKVFSPGSGMLQINTHPNEQGGLRNWFSGVNAALRNPIAHRFVNLDEKSALSAIAMVALMVKIAVELSKRDSKKDRVSTAPKKKSKG